MPSTSALCTPALEADEVRSTTSIQRGAESALSVSFVLFVHNKSHRDHRDTRTLEHYRTYGFKVLYHSPSLCVTPRETLYTQREAARTQKCQKSRRGVNGENVDQMELLKDPLIVVRGGELVAQSSSRASTSQRPGDGQHQPTERIYICRLHLPLRHNDNTRTCEKAASTRTMCNAPSNAPPHTPLHTPHVAPHGKTNAARLSL